MSALLMSTATGLRSLAWASRPEPLRLQRDGPAAGEGVEDRRRVAAGGAQDLLVRGSQQPLVGGVLPDDEPLDELEETLAFGVLCGLVGNSSGRADGSSTSWAKSTARAAASGRRAHHRCSVDGCPWRIDFSRADSRLIASSGRATSMSLRLVTIRTARFLSPRSGPSLP
jgi:hypothetical protein